MKIAVLASGRGSNLQAIIDNIATEKCCAEIGVVLCDQADAKALQRAEKAGIPHYFINPKNFDSKADYEQKLLDIIKKLDCNLIVLAGYMRLIGETLLSAYEGKIINIHPSLLPAFPGLHAQKQAVDYGVKFSGCTVHFIDNGMDTGSIIAQKVVPVFQSDNEETLSMRILEQEHIVYSEVINQMAKNRITLKNGRVLFKEGE